jgi:hypothetical protein
MASKSLTVKLDSEGKQTYLGSWYKPQDLLKKLQHPSQLKDIKKKFEVTIAEDVSGKPCALQRKNCKQLISANNPSQSYKQHQVSCKQPASKELEVDMTEEDGPGCGKRRATQQLLNAYMPSSKQQDEFHKGFMKFVITAELPFKKLDNKYLRAALGNIGINFKVGVCKHASSLVQALCTKK